MCYRIIFGLVNVCVSDFFELHCASQTRGHPFKLYKEHGYSSVRASYFSVRVINVWNSLPADRVDFSSFAAFKQTIEQLVSFYSAITILNLYWQSYYVVTVNMFSVILCILYFCILFYIVGSCKCRVSGLVVQLLF